MAHAKTQGGQGFQLKFLAILRILRLEFLKRKLNHRIILKVIESPLKTLDTYQKITVHCQNGQKATSIVLAKTSSEIKNFKLKIKQWTTMDDHYASIVF